MYVTVDKAHGHTLGSVCQCVYKSRIGNVKGMVLGSVCLAAGSKPVCNTILPAMLKSRY